MSAAAELPADRLIAFNDELAALARAGVPLERGVAALGREQAGPLGEFARELSDRMARGESLAMLSSEQNRTFPPLYRAMVCAGLRSGQLGIALEGLSATTRRLIEMRRSVYAAVLYPLAIVVIAYAVFLFALINLTPTILDSYDGLEVPHNWTVTFMQYLHDTIPYWWPWPPLLLMTWILWEWWTSRRMPQHGLWSPLYTAQRWSRRATFADLLALMVEHQVPLPEAIDLAAAASNDAGLVRASQTWIAQLQQGGAGMPVGFPPMLGYILAAPHPPEAFVRALRRAAGEYQRRAQQTVDWLVLYLPALLTVVVGGGAVLLQTVSFLGPWFYILEQLGRPQ